MAKPKPPKKKSGLAGMSIFDVLNGRTPADVLPARPRGPAPFTPNVLRATPPGIVPQRGPATFWEKQRAIQSALPEIAFQVPQQAYRDISEARTPDQIIAALTGLQFDPAKRGPMNAVALATLLGPEFIGGAARPLKVAERAIATAAERDAARLTPSAMVDFLHGIRPDPLDVPAFARAGGSVRDIGMPDIGSRRVGDLAPIARRPPPNVGASLDVPTFMRHADALAGAGANRNPALAKIASQYGTRSGIRGTALPGVRDVDPNAGRAMAHIYNRLESRPNDPAVKAAYRQLVSEVDAQYRAIEDAGYHIEFVDKDPYANSAEMMADVRDNRRLKVFRTAGENSSGHPLMTNAENERFRAVHDFFGHAVQGNQFGPKGEEAAYRAHSAMFSPEAARAMATETRGQNSWVNFGPHRNKAVTARPYAPQKAALWPQEYMGDYASFPETIIDPVVKGANGEWYAGNVGTNHAEAADAAAAALRATPEGRALIDSHGGNASNRANDAFRTSRGRIVSREEAKFVGGAAGQSPPNLPYAQLHSSDLLPRGDTHAPAATNILTTSKQGRDLYDALLTDEQARLTRRNIPAFEAAARTLSSPETFGAGAIAGAAKRGWYANSARALSEAFGPEAPRFAALLSALSPQQPVSKNFAMALDTWEAWTAHGRPQDPAAIRRIMDDVARATPEGKQMGSRVPNALAALTAEDPATLALSGPKVFSFHRNLIGDAQRVTLDTWMAQLANVKPNSLARTVRKVGVPSPTYLALSGRARQTADYLSRVTGHPWSPAEVQETLWSWGKALSEHAEPLTKGSHPSQFGIEGIIPISLRDAIPTLPASTIAGVPDFASLLRGEPYAASLGRLGLPAPGPAAKIDLPNLPTPDPAALDELAGNMERSQRGIFGNERGAIGGKQTILRIEDEMGVGPYQGGGPANDLYVSDPKVQARQPIPQSSLWDDQARLALQLGNKRFAWPFGFRDEAQMKKWFTPKELAYLSEHGFRVQPYEVQAHVYDQHQAMFPAETAQRLNATPLARDPIQGNLFTDNRVTIPAMLGGLAGASGGGLTLYEYLQGRR
jgi:hypothetical protein